MRYALLSRSRHITNPKTVLPTLTVQDLYEKFHGKEKLIIPTPSKTFNSSVNQNSAFDCQKTSFQMFKSDRQDLIFRRYKIEYLGIYHAITRSYEIYKA